MENKDLAQIVYEFSNAFRRIMDTVSDYDKLGMWVSLLYWHKHKALRREGNRSPEDSTVLATNYLDFLNSMRISLAEEWESTGRTSESLCCDGIDSDTGRLAEQFRGCFKQASNTSMTASNCIAYCHYLLGNQELTSEEYDKLFYLGVKKITTRFDMDIPITYISPEVVKACDILLGGMGRTYLPKGGLFDFQCVLGTTTIDYSEDDKLSTIGRLHADIVGKTSSVIKTTDEDLSESHIYDTLITYLPARGGKQTWQEVYDLFAKFDGMTKEDGKMLILDIPSIVLNGKGAEPLREKAIQENKLDTIVYLPADVIKYGYDGLELLVFKKNRQPGESVKLIDARESYVGSRVDKTFSVAKFKDILLGKDSNRVLHVSQEEFIAVGNIWNFDLYKGKKEYRAPKNSVLYKIGELLLPAETRGCESNSGCILKMDQFSLEPKRLNVEDIEKVEIRDTIGYSVVDSSALFISYSSHLGIVYVDNENREPITFSRRAFNYDVRPYKVKTELVNVDYLMEEISKIIPYCNVGTFLGRVGEKTLLSFKIGVPPIEQQMAIAAKAEKERLLKKANDIGLDLEQVKADYRDDVHLKKHAIGQTVANLGGWIDMLVTACKSGVIDVNAVFGRRQNKVGYVIDNLLQQRDKLEKQLETFDRGHRKVPEWFNLSDFIEAFFERNRYPNIDYIFDKRFTEVTGFTENERGDCLETRTPVSDYKVYFPKEALNIVLQNIVSNAQSHGFQEGASNNQIKFTITSGERGEIYLTVANNGVPFANEILKDIFKYGITTKTDADMHYGLGGYEIKQMMQQFDGGVEVYNADITDAENTLREFTATYKLVFYNTNLNDNDKGIVG